MVPGRISSASLWRTALEQAGHTVSREISTPHRVKQQIFLFIRGNKSFKNQINDVKHNSKYSILSIFQLQQNEVSRI